MLGAPGVAGLLDLTRPVGLLAVAVLHFVPDDVAAILADYRVALAPGSIVAFNHVSDDLDDSDLAERARAGAGAYRGSASQGVLRSRPELELLLTGLEVVPPGLVDITAWPAPQPNASPTVFYAALGVVPPRRP